MATVSVKRSITTTLPKLQVQIFGFVNRDRIELQLDKTDSTFSTSTFQVIFNFMSFLFPTVLFYSSFVYSHNC